MIDDLDRYLGRLLKGAGACAALIWAFQHDSAEGSIVRTCPAGYIPDGTRWLANCHANLVANQRSPATLANILPISVQRELRSPPTVLCHSNWPIRT